MKILVLCPHFAPDTAPTGTVMTGIVDGLRTRGHEIHIVTSLPWYRHHQVVQGWTGRLVRTELTDWGSITRVHPFPSGDKRNLFRRAVGFIGFTLLAGLAAVRPGGWFRKVDAVFAMSPPLTLGLTGWLIAKVRRGRFVFNIQDVFPDAAIQTGAITNAQVIRIASALERLSYRRADVVTVLSEDLAENVLAKLATGSPTSTDVVVIPNFVDTEKLAPTDGDRYRAEFDLGIGPLVMYAGNLGYSQSLDLMIRLAEQRPDITVVVNGDGAMRETIVAATARVPNLRYIGYQPAERLAEVLSAADIHVVPLRTGLGSLVSGFVVIKAILQNIHGWLFGNKKLLNEIVFKKNSFFNYGSMVLFTANILYAFIPFNAKLLFYSSLFLFVSITLIGWILILRNYQKYILHNVFYFILYLCALEIAPFLIIASIFNT